MENYIMGKDIRWAQRFDSYKKALGKLSNAVEFIGDEANLFSDAAREVSNEGLIQCFEFTAELAWNVMKDYLYEDGVKNISGSKDAIRNSFSYGLIEDGQIWLDMIQDRNLVSHTYNENIAKSLVSDIIGTYYPALIKFREKMGSFL
jgi:nucleotidyltransferase substrate binding protein (TIGR01987 family)